MERLKIIATLVPAVRSDFLTAAGDLREAVTVFIKKGGFFTGPYLSDNLFLDEILALIEADFYYVVKGGLDERQGYTVKLFIRQALPKDFTDYPNYPRYHRLYYICQDNQVTGPFIYMANTNMPDFEKRLQDKLLYVVHEHLQIKIPVV